MVQLSSRGRRTKVPCFRVVVVVISISLVLATTGRSAANDQDIVGAVLDGDFVSPSPQVVVPVVLAEAPSDVVTDDDLTDEATSLIEKLRNQARSASPEERARAIKTLDVIRTAIDKIPYVPGRQIYSMDGNGLNLQSITNNQEWAFGSPVFSPDGRAIAYDAWPSDRPFWTSRVYTSALDGSDIRDHGPGAMPDWTSDSSTLLIHTYPLSDGRIVAVNLLDGARRNILNHQGSNPRVSPDATKLAFVDRDAYIKVWDINERFEHGLRELTFATDWTPLTGLSWSPDNRRLACVRPQRGSSRFELIVLSINGQDEPLEVLASGDINRVVAWHPTRNAILFSTRDSGDETYQFRLHDLDNHQSSTLPNQHPGLQCLEMAWSRDGEQIVFIGEKVARGE